MAGDFVNRLKQWAIGGQTLPDDSQYYDTEYDSYSDEESEPEVPIMEMAKRKRVSEVESSNIVNINNIQMKIETRHPETMTEAGEIRELVKSNVAVVVNLEGTDHPIAQRLVDYLSGVADSLDGDLQCISNRIFVVAPKNIELSGDFRKNFRTEGLSFSFAGDL